jgi:integrase
MMSEEGVIKLAGDGDNALNPVPRRNDLFGSVSDMIRAGWCYKDRVSLTMIRIRPEWKVGIPDEDMVLTPEEVVRFLGAIEPFNEPYRLLFEFFFRVGARISQMVEVRVCDLDFNKQTVFIQPRKEGNAFYRKLDAEFMFRLKDWIDHYGLVDEDYLFCVRREGIPRNRPCTWKKISSYTNRKVAQEVLQYYAAKAGLDYRYVDSYGILRHRISPHTIKKTFLSIVYSHCKDSLLTSLTTGNKTTACVEKHYIKIPAAKRNAVVTQALQEIFGVPEVEIRALTEPPAT